MRETNRASTSIFIVQLPPEFGVSDIVFANAMESKTCGTEDAGGGTAITSVGVLTIGGPLFDLPQFSRGRFATPYASTRRSAYFPNWAWLRETNSVIDDGCWKQVWAEMTDSALEDRLFTYLWLSLHTPNSHADRVAQLIEEAERRGQAGTVERARMKAETTPIANAE